jgi:CheY-like chemotaxis protein
MCSITPELKLRYLHSPMPTFDSSQSSDDQASARILVIEDNIDDQDILIRQLQKAGVQERVLCVENGNDAYNLVQDGARKLSAVCAIFLDLSLPGINGLLLLQAIRSNVATALLPVFVLTGSANPKDEAECQRLGATRFIPKKLLSLPSFRSTLAGIFHPEESVPVETRPKVGNS